MFASLSVHIQYFAAPEHVEIAEHAVERFRAAVDPYSASYRLIFRSPICRMGRAFALSVIATDGDGRPLKLPKPEDSVDVSMLASKEQIVSDVDAAVDKLASNILDEHCIAAHR